MSAQVPALRPARVTVTLKDGRQATASRTMSRRDEERPDPDPEVRVKYHELAGTVLTPEGTPAVERAIGRAEDWVSASDLVALLRRYSQA